MTGLTGILAGNADLPVIVITWIINRIQGSI